MTGDSTTWRRERNISDCELFYRLVRHGIAPRDGRVYLRPTIPKESIALN